MRKYISIRLLTMAVNMLVIIVFTYFALSFAKYIKYTDYTFSQYVEATWENFKLYIQEIISKGDWGYSNYSDDGESLWALLWGRILISMRINLVALAWYLPVGIGLGVIAALFKDTILDRAIIYVTTLSSSIPVYIVMFLLVMFVGYFWRIVDYSFNPNEQLLIPVLALMIHPVSIFSKVIRGDIIESLSSDYVLLARTKGLTRNQAIVRHTFKNSIVAVLPEIPTAFLFALTGSFLVELIYNVHGVAELFYGSLISISPIGTFYVNIDIAVVMVISIFYTTMAFLVSFTCDVLLRVFDPRINITGKKV